MIDPLTGKITRKRDNPRTRQNKEKILTIVREYCAAHGYSPSMNDIARALYGHDNAGNANPLVQQLLAEGKLKRVPGQRRTLQVVENS